MSAQIKRERDSLINWLLEMHDHEPAGRRQKWLDLASDLMLGWYRTRRKQIVQ